ncbi:MAG: hypothetical protein PHI68_08940, partial [Candidatus Cloacimonetes bacterium]|nr:hypothetical protein [Candidatus Cloacimonadota bacterium]
MNKILVSFILLIVLSMAFADENDTPAGATLVNVPVNGSQYEIDNEDDIDWYKFQITQPGNLLIYLTRPSGDLDPALWIYGPHNANGADVIPSEPVTYDDDGHGNLLPEISLYAPNPGYYFLRVSSYEDYPYDEKSGFRGIGSYALHISWDGDVGNLIYPAELEFMSSGGSQYVQVSSNGAWTISENVTWLTCDPASGHGNAYFNLIVDPNVDSPRYTNITITFADGEPASANLYVYQNQPNYDDNNTPQSATQLSLPINGNLYQIESEDDIDWYRFHLEQEDIYRFWLTRPSGDLDPTFWLYGPSDEFGSTFIPTEYIASDDDSY